MTPLQAAILSVDRDLHAALDALAALARQTQTLEVIVRALSADVAAMRANFNLNMESSS